MSSPPLSSRHARILLGAVVGLALLEGITGAVVYADALEPSDWEAASSALAELPDHEPVWLGTPWLAPRARMHLPRMARWESVAAPDLRGASRFHVLGLSGDAWSDALQDDLEDLPAPTVVDTRELGGLVLTTYEQAAATAVVGDLVSDAARVEVRTSAGSCRGRARRTCEEGKVGVAVVEVDYRPRRCWKVEVQDGAVVTLRHPQLATGTVLRGHVGVDDFNRRLRNDAPTRLRLRVDGEPVAQWLVSDEQGWWPFAVATEPGTHDVEIEITPAVGGTWQRGGFDPGRIHAPCVELRGLQEEQR